jgi:hypothetical protein
MVAPFVAPPRWGFRRVMRTITQGGAALALGFDNAGPLGLNAARRFATR